MKRLSVLLITPTEYGSGRWGGVATYTKTLASELTHIGHSVTILSPGNAVKRHGSGNRSVTVPPARMRGIGFLSRIMPLTAGRLQWMLAVKKYVDSADRFDAIESPEWGSSTLLLSLSGYRTICVRLHRSLFQYYRDNRLSVSADLCVVNGMEMLSAFLSEVLTAPTRFIMHAHPLVLGLRRAAGKPVILLPNGIPLPAGSRTSGIRKPYILCVGRLETAKGQLELIRAFSEIRTKHPRVSLVLSGRDTNTGAGQTSYLATLEHEIRIRNLEGRVMITGHLSQNDLARWYRDCLFYVCPSHGTENHPISLLDAIGWGKATVAARTGGLPEIVTNRRNGLLYAPGSQRELAGALDTLLTDSRTRRMMEKHTGKLHKRYDIRSVARRTAVIYGRLGT